MKIYKIPRSNKTDRCGECLKSFLKTQKFYSKGRVGLRFPRVCYRCKDRIANSKQGGV